MKKENILSRELVVAEVNELVNCPAEFLNLLELEGMTQEVLEV